MAKRLYVLMLLAVCAVAQTVEGSVFNAATGTAASGVKVELLKGTTPFYETTSDGGGRFRFDNIKEGDYSVRYQSPDYFLTAGPTDYRPFPVAAGSPVKLEARLMPWSKISGRVVDSRGNAVAKAELELTGTGMLSGNRIYLRTSWGGGGGMQLGAPPTPMSFRGSSDANGKFEVLLMPGSYGLSVVPPPELKPPEPEPDGPVLGWKRSYYPGVALPEAASKIVALPGEVSEIELKLLALPTHSVRGVLLNPDGTPAPKVQVALAEDFRGRSVESKADGTFEFAAVPEGEWRLWATVQSGGVPLHVTEWIEVTKHDIESVKLRLVPPLTVRGKVTMEPAKDSPLPKMSPMILARHDGRTRKESDLELIGESSPLSADTNGNILAQAYPGMYRLSSIMQPPPPPYYLDALRVGDANLITQEVEFSSADVAITVVYKTDGGVVRGTAENCASGGVELVPQDPSLRRGFARSGPCDSSNHYEVRTVRPGEYYALAFAGNGPVLAVDEALLNQAVKITVRAGEASSADLKAITRPVY
jgi:Carboxypeptidase regulatory-like domain